MSALSALGSGAGLRDPVWLLLALALPAALWIRRRRGSPALPFAPAGLIDPAGEPGGAPLPRSPRARAARAPRALELLALLAAIVALARPVRREQEPLEAQGIDILLCLDVSSSMEARDLDPARTRLEVAREAAQRFLAARPADRVGLIAFARYADVVSPLTLGHEALASLLAEVRMVEPEGPEDLTGIGNAVARAATVLERGGARSAVVILFTDGEENVATGDDPRAIAPARAAELCSERGVRVYSIVAGVGKPAPGGGWQPLDTRAVEALARATGGAFFEVRDAQALAGVYATIDGLETTAFSEPRTRQVDAFLPLVVLALAAFVAARLLEAGPLEVLA